MNTYQVTVRFRENGRHRQLELLAPDSDTLYQKLDFVLENEPAYDVTSVKLDGEELLVDERGDPITDEARMDEAASRDNARKWATSVLRDWDRPDSWSSGTLMASATDLVKRADLRDLTVAQRERLYLIAGGALPRPQLEDQQ
jgi:hypothetical protein